MSKKFLLSLTLAASTFTAKAADGDSIWGVPVIHDIYLDFTQVGYWDTLLATHANDTYTYCTMTFDGVWLPYTGIKMKGNSSFNNQSKKKSFKIDLNEYVPGQDYDGIKKFNLNNGFKDPTFIREKLTLDYMRRHGMHAPRCTYARVYINNAYWGLYLLVEDINSKFLNQHYGNDEGNLFKGDPAGDLRWWGTSVSSYTNRYELDETLTNDWTDLINLIDTINNSPSSTYYSSVEYTLMGHEFLQNMAINNIFVNLDSYCGSGHNYYIYHDSLFMKWRWIPWDVNETFGSFTLGMTPTQLKNLAFDYINQPTNRPLAAKMMADPTYRQVYINEYCLLMANFTNDYLDPYIDSLANLIRPDVYADTLKFYSDQDFETNLTSDITGSGPNGGNILGLKDFIAARHASLETQLAPYGCYLAVNESNAVNSTFHLYPNPATENIWVNVPETWSEEEFTVDIVDASGRIVKSMSYYTGTKNYVMEVGDLQAGLYLMIVKNTHGSSLSYRFCKST